MNEIWLSCIHFKDCKVGCCSSCHEDEWIGYHLSESYHAKDRIIVNVCCAVRAWFNELDDQEKRHQVAKAYWQWKKEFMNS